MRFDIDVDDVDDPDGTIMVTLEEQAAGVSKTYTVGSQKTASVNVSEYELSIADSFANEKRLTEDVQNTITFEVTLSPAASSEVSVKWDIVDEQGENVLQPDTDLGVPQQNLRRVVFEAGETIKSFSITIVDNEMDEPNKTFTVMLSNQTAGVTLNKASATGTIVNDDVQDIESIQITISAVDESVPEGAPAQFKLESKQGVTSEGFEVFISVSDPGSYLKWRIPRTFTMKTSPFTLSFETQDDEIVEDGDDDSIRVTVLSIDGSYSVGEMNSASVNIVNDDTPESVEEQPRISVAQVAVNAIIDFVNEPTSNPPSFSQPEIAFAPTTTRPLVSISSVDKQIDEGSSARFLISNRNGDPSVYITIFLQVQQTRVQIEGPTSMEIQLSGQDTRSVSIVTINDGHADEDGFISLSISESPDYLVSSTAGSAVVRVSDATDRQNRKSDITARTQSFMPELTGAIGANTLETVSNRIELGFSEESNQVLELGGQNSISGMLTASGDAINESSTTLKSFLGNSSFAISLFDDEFVIPTTFWGLGDYQKLSKIDNGKAFDWSGDLFMGHFGIDALIRDGVLAGISASVVESEIKFDNIDTNNIEFDIRTTSLNPYIGWTSTNHNSKVHATGGFGLGEIGIDQNAYSYETLNSESYSYGLSGSQVLVHI